MFNTGKISQTVVAAVAALLFSATAIGAAVGPAEAAGAPQSPAASVRLA